MFSRGSGKLFVTGVIQVSRLLTDQTEERVEFWRLQ